MVDTRTAVTQTVENLNSLLQALDSITTSQAKLEQQNKATAESYNAAATAAQNLAAAQSAVGSGGGDGGYTGGNNYTTPASDPEDENLVVVKTSAYTAQSPTYSHTSLGNFATDAAAISAFHSFLKGQLQVGV